MRDLVPEMAEQRAVGLAHGLALALALGVVGFRNIEGDEPAGVPGDDRRRLRRSIGRRRGKSKARPFGSSMRVGERQASFNSV